MSDLTPKQQAYFNKVKKLIEEGDFDKAREMLLKVQKHPTAQRWLQDLELIENANNSPKIKNLTSLTMKEKVQLASIILLLIFTMCLITYIWVDSLVSPGGEGCPNNCSEAVSMGMSASSAAACGLDRDGDGVACYGD